ncbi:type 1 glutamine amidotransferase [Nocardioides sp. J2M5]|uniref:type 1 glutamine amidotransferase n=1 Tax=Nocardioides palaemonis TaxID=2829810 RepID=UPI001BAA9E56|nr:type 1 glutamine amidotransferase [Nocardioides palaemonis]MBS2938544.1 type 1 glutamine amidotransferase [Nocardioides palaemonis]
MSPRVLVVEHQASCPPHLVGRWLEDAGCVLEVCRPYAGDPLPPPTAYDAVLVLGGDMGAYDDDRAPWLPAVRERVREAVAAGTPVLGICLGHQVLAVALGGEVARNPRGQTVGLQPVGWSDATADDAWVGGRTGDEVAIHWNNDVVVAMPDGGVVLARTPGGEVQVARFADRAWGVQAHPEVDADVVAGWAADDRDDLVALGLDEAAVVAAVADAEARLEEHWRPLVERFAAIAGGNR